MRKLFRKIFVSQDASLVREREFFILMDAGCEPKSRGDFMHLCRQTKKPIKYAFLTHHHWDHVHNINYFRERFPGIEVFSNHRLGSLMRFQKEESMLLGDTEYIVIPTPGHSPKGDDICIHMPEKKTVFVGDLCQPQGPSYHKTDFATPVPYFHLGEEYIRSLKRVLSLEVNHVITGHGMIYRKKALETTLEAAERIREIARETVKKNPGMKNTLAARTIFERVAHERGFHNPEWRMKDPYYRECDIQGLLYWVKKFKGEYDG
ncbi:MAG TPA: MBL fold metallo-hydrolase [archaeon]|nr:MBL fold metallo-hydrolase [archaeon]